MRPELARDLLTRFADRTGLTSSAPPRRYLWTDAFAVCTFLGLGETQFALALVDQVHRVLGQHRGDDARHGWLDGASEDHPTRGGLRIGKPLPEDAADDWEADGQYFHYLTRWMHALDRVTRRTGKPRYREWARELAETAHRAFIAPGGGRMYWKMSIDLSRPMAPSQGQHDPLDGLVTCLQLGAPALALDFVPMIDPAALVTDDPLGLGGLLVDAHKLEQLDHPDTPPGLVETLHAVAAVGLRHYRIPPREDRRLAFRELGLAIGLAAAEPASPLRAAIEGHWMEPSNRGSDLYLDHADINDVMLATSLMPDGYLQLRGDS